MNDSYQPIYDAIRAQFPRCNAEDVLRRAIIEAANWDAIVITAQAEIQDSGYSARRPSVVYRPALFPDGDQWCALYGENLQEGLAGFGDTPDAAMRAFDENWVSQKLTRSPQGEDRG